MKTGFLNQSMSHEIPSPTSSNDNVKTVATSDIKPTTSNSGSLLAELEIGHKFELQNITVLFPEGLLAVVAGPTASRKTALLVLLATKSNGAPEFRSTG